MVEVSLKQKNNNTDVYPYSVYKNSSLSFQKQLQREQNLDRDNLWRRTVSTESSDSFVYFNYLSICLSIYFILFYFIFLFIYFPVLIHCTNKKKQTI